MRVRSARGAVVDYHELVTDGLLKMRVAGGLTGDVYGVQLNINGKWRDVTNLGIKNNGKVGVESRVTVYANVSGYADGKYQVRVFNRTRGIYDLAIDSFEQGLVELKMNLYITPGEHNKEWPQMTHDV